MKNILTALAVSSAITTASFAAPYQEGGKWYEPLASYTGDQTFTILNSGAGDKETSPRRSYEFSVAEGQSIAVVNIDTTVRGWDFTVNKLWMIPDVGTGTAFPIPYVSKMMVAPQEGGH